MHSPKRKKVIGDAINAKRVKKGKLRRAAEEPEVLPQANKRTIVSKRCNGLRKMIEMYSAEHKRKVLQKMHRG